MQFPAARRFGGIVHENVFPDLFLFVLPAGILQWEIYAQYLADCRTADFHTSSSAHFKAHLHNHPYNHEYPDCLAHSRNPPHTDRHKYSYSEAYLWSFSNASADADHHANGHPTPSAPNARRPEPQGSIVFGALA